MLVLVLLSARLAHAAPPPPMLGRQVTLPAGPTEPPPVLRMGPGIVTLLLFDAPIVLTSVQVDETLVKVVDGGERSLILVLLRPPAVDERPGLRVRYADEATPQWATFTLAAPPSAVDTQLHVRRWPQPLEACQAELVQARALCDRSPEEVWVLARRLGEESVTAMDLYPTTEVTPISGLRVERGLLYRSGTFWLFVLTVDNAPDREPWAPTEAALVPVKQQVQPVAIRTVSLEDGPLAPGARGRLAVETEVPPTADGLVFTLTVWEPRGRQLTYSIILPEPQSVEEKR
jgi:uncharacterized protein (TIGR02268 family)